MNIKLLYDKREISTKKVFYYSEISHESGRQLTVYCMRKDGYPLRIGFARYPHSINSGLEYAEIIIKKIFGYTQKRLLKEIKLYELF